MAIFSEAPPLKEASVNPLETHLVAQPPSCTPKLKRLHTQHLHRLKCEDWEQLRNSGFPIDQAWGQGLGTTTKQWIPSRRGLGTRITLTRLHLWTGPGGRDVVPSNHICAMGFPLKTLTLIIVFSSYLPYRQFAGWQTWLSLAHFCIFGMLPTKKSFLI